MIGSDRRGKVAARRAIWFFAASLLLLVSVPGQATATQASPLNSIISFLEAVDLTGRALKWALDSAIPLLALRPGPPRLPRVPLSPALSARSSSAETRGEFPRADAPLSVGDIGRPVEFRPATAGAGAPLVGLYHTHATESFLPTSGTEFSLDPDLTVVAVGRELARALAEEQGIRTVHVGQIHDIPSRAKAYAASLATAKDLVDNYPTLLFVLDIHRDARPRAQTTALSGQERVAKIAVVVGTSRRAGQADWVDNYNLAKAVVRQLESTCPGLCSGIITKNDTYNQHLHPGALLLEIGGHENSLEEATRAARLLARALAGAVRELQGQFK